MGRGPCCSSWIEKRICRCIYLPILKWVPYPESIVYRDVISNVYSTNNNKAFISNVYMNKKISLIHSPVSRYTLASLVDCNCSEEIMFRRKHGSQFNSNDVEQREAKIKELKTALGPLSGRSEMYCSEACLTRYLEAHNWNVTKSRKMLEESLKWREAYRPEDIRWPDVSVEAETGKMYRASFRDREGRTVVVMKPAKQNTTSHEGQIRFLVYVLENSILSLSEGQEKMVWLIDFTGWTMANATPIKTARESANILQNHYPERLAIGFLFNPPKVFEAFWKIIKIFLDPRSIEKVNFVYLKDEGSLKVMHKYIDPEVLPVEFGGKSSVVYNHEEYSELMMKDDLKTASFWAEDPKTDYVNHATNGTGVREGEVTPRSSLIAAKAS